MTLSANARNFSGGPGALPETVLVQLREAMIAVPEVGLSVLGISHRSDWFAAVVAEVETRLKALLALPPDFHVLLLQGGGTLQFAMVPLALARGADVPAEYLHTGYWSGKAIAEARKLAPVRVVWRGEDEGFSRLPDDEELVFDARAPYLHVVTNETVEGLQFHRLVGLEEVPRVADMSSDFLSRPFDAGRYALIYAHAQKNLGPAGVTVVLVREAVLKRAPEGLPAMLDYRAQAQAHSILNTPPVFAIYAVLLVLRWLMDEIGGLEAMAAINRAKAERLYGVLDASEGFYRPRARRADRSLMNVVFDLPSEALRAAFLAEANRAGFAGLAGHRALGGIRVSIYNAVTLEAVEALADFMETFRRRH